MRNLEERIDFYIPRLTGPHAEDAWHSLNEMGHKGVPLLIDRFNKVNQDIRSKLIESFHRFYEFLNDSIELIQEDLE